MAKKKESLSFLYAIHEYFVKVGYLKAIYETIIIVFIGLGVYFAANPEKIFEKYDKYTEYKHNKSFKQRIEVTPLVQVQLDKLSLESKCLRAFVIEMHNGKYNSAGLSFNYGMLTYESTRDSVESIREDYYDFSLDRYPVLLEVYKNGYWSGSVEELCKIDKKLSLRLQSNNAEYIALSMIYGKDENIGFIGVTYSNDDIYSSNDVRKLLSKYSAIISPYLDGQN